MSPPALDPILDADEMELRRRRPILPEADSLRRLRLPDTYIGLSVVYSGSVDRSDDVRFRVAKTAKSHPFPAARKMPRMVRYSMT